MSAIIRAIPTKIAPAPALAILAVLLTIIFGSFALINFIIRDWTTVWERECTVTEWKESGEIGFVVDCGDGSQDVITDLDVVRSYMNDSGPLVCRGDLTSDIECDPRPKREEVAE